MSIVADWQAWHADYGRPDSPLSRRLVVVRQRVAEALADSEVGRILSLCSGDGRDLIPVLAELPAAHRPEAVLVELDESLAAAARQRAADEGVTASVVTGDAGLVETWQHVTPVDLLMLCGIFGNVPDADVQGTIAAAKAFLRPGGRVIWTRGHFGGHDMRPTIRRWFQEAGFVEVEFDSEPIGFGVGVHNLTSADLSAAAPGRLFSFTR